MNVFPQSPREEDYIGEVWGETQVSVTSVTAKKPMTPLERASRYVEAMPPAISGSGGHNATFRVACTLVHGFNLSDEHAWMVLTEYNGRCEPPWNERELRHKLEQARKVQHRHAAGHLLRPSSSPPQRRGSEPLRLLGVIPMPERKPTTPKPAPEDREARRIAGELAKMHADGLIGDPSGPFAELMAFAIRVFKAEYVTQERRIGRAPDNS